MSSTAPEATIPVGEHLTGAEILTIRTGVAERPYKEPGEDRVIQQEQLGLYGVIDGMGGHSGGYIAAAELSEGITETVHADQRSYRPDNCIRLFHDAFANGHKRMRAYAATNATSKDDGIHKMGAAIAAAKFFTYEGRAYVVYGIIGDVQFMQLHSGTGALERSQEEVLAPGAYIEDKRTGAVRRLTDLTMAEAAELNETNSKFIQSKGNLLLNSVQANTPLRLTQINFREVKDGDVFGFFSDGITGDLDEQRLSEEQYRYALTHADPQEGAQYLLEASLKDLDDKAGLIAHAAVSVAADASEASVSAHDTPTGPNGVIALQETTEQPMLLEEFMHSHEEGRRIGDLLGKLTTIYNGLMSGNVDDKWMAASDLAGWNALTGGDAVRDILKRSGIDTSGAKFYTMANYAKLAPTLKRWTDRLVQTAEALSQTPSIRPGMGNELYVLRNGHDGQPSYYQKGWKVARTLPSGLLEVERPADDGYRDVKDASASELIIWQSEAAGRA